MYVPPELTDLIIDHLAHDPRTLASCTLVCKTFFPRSHTHLFSRITIGHPSRANSARQFLPLLPYVGDLVKSLRIEAECGFRDKDNTEGDFMMMNDLIDELLWKTAHDKQWVSHDPALPTILTSLPNLTSLEIRALRWRNPWRVHQCTPSFEHTLAAIAPQVASLRLDYVHFDSLPGLLGILSTFRGMKKLALGVIMAPPYPVVLTGKTTEPLEIEELEANMEGSARVVEVLMASPWAMSFGRLKKLRVKRCYRAQMELVRVLVDLSRGSLEELAVDDCVLPVDHVNRCPPLDVHHLKSLSVTLSSDCFPRLMRWWVGALGREETSKIQYMTLAVEHRSVANVFLDKESWSALSQVLDHDRMGALRRVDIVVKAWRGLGEVVKDIRNTIRESCASMMARDIIHVYDKQHILM
ncbi:uncharacterized protein EV420DRAFT_1767296 [Desarmillaria tabescens]|uniref:F-box domain-containing protein n=1 Tax=Armillaria tabescens TaxID=1929756 RepID=A0AA39JVB7_ARMTA|nr:uncharacterized protein EV420DRAFT_1767296 [Desarmillaria tabescens]KAK0448481.1 hypothetical protein EV420DRAFT_1767296 [Desarmillaria tabescens]